MNRAVYMVEIKRKAIVGEKIKVTSHFSTSKKYGDILTVREVDDSQNLVRTLESRGAVFHNDYVVLV